MYTPHRCIVTPDKTKRKFGLDFTLGLSLFPTTAPHTHPRRPRFFYKKRDTHHCQTPFRKIPHTTIAPYAQLGNRTHPTNKQKAKGFANAPRIDQRVGVAKRKKTVSNPKTEVVSIWAKFELIMVACFSATPLAFHSFVVSKRRERRGREKKKKHPNTDQRV